MVIRLLTHVSCAALIFAGTALAADADSETRSTITVTGQRAASIENVPSTLASIDAARIEDTINATNVEDILKYFPSLVVRKRHIGDTQAPLATRTSGVGASARSLIYADGALLSALIGNNNSTASPRWGLVSPQEVARTDVLYGPFSAAYPGNSIGAVVNITTRLPDRLEASLEGGVNLQRFGQYATSGTYPAYQLGGTIGDRFGPLAFFISANHVTSDSQPLAYVTAVRPSAPGAAGTRVTGAFDALNRSGVPIAVIGAGGFEHQSQDNIKLKLALDATPTMALAYVGGVFLNDTDATAETYLRDAGGQSVFAGSENIGGYAYTIPSSAFSNNVYRFDERHWAHSLSAKGSGSRLDWQVIGTLYDYDKAVQRTPGTALPLARAGGAGSITRLDGTGWTTFDAKGMWKSDEESTHAISFGYHFDRFRLNSNRYATTDWLTGSEGALNLASRGKTQVHSVWVQDVWKISEPITLTLGGRYEWWKAYTGFNFSLTPALAVSQPELSADRFSPKASLAWTPASNWTVSLSFGEAYRFPTVTELYQAVTTGPSIAVPNPALRPERAQSEELSVQRADARGYVRLSAFNENIRDALLSQTAPLLPGSSTLFSYVQNVDRVRARGIEFAFQHQDLVLRGFDLAGSFTFVDARIRADAAFAAAVGKQTPQVPRTKATLVATLWPDGQVALTAAARYSARSFGTIDNGDPVSHTYQAFDGYFIVDLRANFKMAPNWAFGIGVDNVNDDRYFLFHPFPGRSFVVDARWSL